MSLDFSIFKEVATHPRHQLDRYLKQGKKVIGCFPLYTPDALIYAAGMLPFGMWGAELEVSRAKKYYPAYICGILQTNLEVAMRGGYGGVLAVLIPTLCDSLKCASQNWKYAVPSIEMIPVNYPQNRDSKGAFDFLYQQFFKIKKNLERISGGCIKEDALKQAIAIDNYHSDVMNQFLDLVSSYPAEVSPENRSYVIKSGYFMDKAEHTKLVQKLIEELKKMQPKRFRGIRVVTTGIIADSPDLLKLFAENKISIAADEVAHESRQFRVKIKQDEKDGIAGLVRQYLNRYGCSTVIGGQMKREELICQLVEKYQADGVVMLMTKFCDPEEYDYPSIKEALEKQKIPLLTIEVDKQIVNYGQASTALQSFQEMIRL